MGGLGLGLEGGGGFEELGVGAGGFEVGVG